MGETMMRDTWDLRTWELCSMTLFQDAVMRIRSRHRPKLADFQRVFSPPFDGIAAGMYGGEENVPNTMHTFIVDYIQGLAQRWNQSYFIPDSELTRAIRAIAKKANCQVAAERRVRQ
jgi:hypothetical protein